MCEQWSRCDIENDLQRAVTVEQDAKTWDSIPQERLYQERHDPENYDELDATA